MRKFIGTLIFATLLAGPAFAQSCVIVVPSKGPHPSWFQWEPIYRHEIAHCNGWVHDDSLFHAKVGKGYISHPIPRKYDHAPTIAVETRGVTIKEAQKQCDGHWGCQWFE